MQTNLDDVITCSPEWELKQNVIIPPTIDEGDSSSPTGVSDSSTWTSANEFAFDTIVKDLESWLDDISKDESPLLEEPTSNPLREKGTKVPFIPCKDDHLPKLSDLLITGEYSRRIKIIISMCSDLNLLVQIVHYTSYRTSRWIDIQSKSISPPPPNN